MKKFAYTMSLCLVMFLGMLGFAGCSGNVEVIAISIDNLPTKTVYSVFDVLDVSGGSFVAEYSNGTTRTFSMSHATSAYVEYSDNVQRNTFLRAAENQVITIKYGGQKTTFNVRVNKASLSPRFETAYSTIYDGSIQPVNITTESLGLPAGIELDRVEYKLVTEPVSAYVNEAPTEEGIYNVKLVILGGINYEDYISTDEGDIIVYTIAKSSLADLSTNKILEFKNREIVYGTTINPEANWIVDTTGVAKNINTVLPSDVTDNLVYEYKKSDESEYHEFTSDTVLDVGNYAIRIRGAWDKNISTYNKDISNAIIVTAYTLQYGTDYNFVITRTDSGSSQEVEYTPTIDRVIQTTMTFDAVDDIADNVQVAVVFNAKYTGLFTGASVTFKTGTDYTTDTQVVAPGNYQMCLRLSQPNPNYIVTNSTDENFQAFNIVVE